MPPAPTHLTPNFFFAPHPSQEIKHSVTTPGFYRALTTTNSFPAEPLLMVALRCCRTYTPKAPCQTVTRAFLVSNDHRR